MKLIRKVSYIATSVSCAVCIALSCSNTLISMAEYNVSAEQSDYISGDVSGNGEIDLYDAIEISKYIMGIRNFTAEEKTIADYNEDGTIDLYDAIGIAKVLLSAANQSGNFTLPNIITTEAYTISLEDTVAVSGDYLTKYVYDIDQDGKFEIIGKYEVTEDLNSEGGIVGGTLYCVFKDGSLCNSYCSYRFNDMGLILYDGKYYIACYWDYGHGVWESQGYHVLFPYEFELCSGSFLMYDNESSSNSYNVNGVEATKEEYLAVYNSIKVIG